MKALSSYSAALFLLLLALILAPCDAQDLCPCNAATNRTALLYIFMSLQGPHWQNGYNTNWGNGSTSICEWKGLSCWYDDTFSIQLPLDAGLDGVLPHGAFSYLNNVGQIDISIANACNALPASLGSASRLTSLQLTGSWTGPLPETWGQLHLLTEITLEASSRWPTCSVASTLPASWSGMTGLQRLTFFGFNLTGALPGSWSSMGSLTSLFLAHNALSGPLPPSWAKLAKLQQLYLNHNSLSGSVPSEWANFMPSELRLNNNAFNGTVPANWQPPLRQPQASLSLQYNRFRGSLPNLGSGYSYVSMNASHNAFSGPLPPEWSSFYAGLSADVSHNQLSGTPDLCVRPNYQNLILAYNQFSGMPNVSCYAPGSCATVLDPNVLDGNNFCGVCSLPSCVGCAAVAGHTIPEEFDIEVLEVTQEECCAACRNTTSCVAAVVLTYHGYPFCTLKNATEPLIPKEGRTVILASSSVMYNTRLV